MQDVWLSSALWTGLGLIAALLSIWLDISVALIEVFIGAIAANSIGPNAAPLSDFLGGLGTILLAFLAGAEIRWSANAPGRI
jgi:Kef-type K+ transport system membrane component KefB